MKDPDKQHKEYYNKDYKRGFDDGKKHSQPSPITLELIDNMQDEIKKINEKLDLALTKKDLELLEQRIALVNKDIVQEIFKEVEKKYIAKDSFVFQSIKWTTWGLGTLFLAILMGAFIIVFLGVSFPIYKL